ncbi:MAG TPA: hypothetical protein VJM31_03045 [Vicinamibacterales bacterium]|nr:hypothetical protein [Vicinamibacterales bacterium]
MRGQKEKGKGQREEGRGGMGAWTVNALKASAVVVLLLVAYVFTPDSSSDPSRNLRSRQSPMGLLPYQQLVKDTPLDEQRIFRDLQRGLLEAERIRAATGRWPDVATLADARIPPFAPDPSQNMRYTWTSVRQDWVTNYLGIPAESAAPAWVLVILEPEPGAPPDLAPNDETHHRLPDGTTLHVSIWRMPEAKRRSGFTALRLPQHEGWTNVVTGPN